MFRFWRSLATMPRNYQIVATLGIITGLVGFCGMPASALPPTAAQDGTGTIVTRNNRTFDITGGTLSGDCSNLFHSFSQFNLGRNQGANFISSPGVNNILGRVVGGSPSVINGLVQVTNGNSNLFLINPSGIIFGATASLNVPASFTATDASAIGFGNNWFSVAGNNNYANLNGNPDNFAFPTLGSINSSNVVVSSDPGFPLQISIPVDSRQVVVGQVDRVFRLSSPRNILSLEVNALQFCQQVGGCPNGVLPDNWSLPLVELPRLLTLGAEALGVNPPNSPPPNPASPLNPANPANGLANSSTSQQLNGLLQGQNPQNLSPTSLGVALAGNIPPSQQLREPGSVGNSPLPVGTASINAGGGVLPRVDTRLVLENSVLPGGDRQVINLREPSLGTNPGISPGINPATPPALALGMNGQPGGIGTAPAPQPSATTPGILGTPGETVMPPVASLPRPGGILGEVAPEVKPGGSNNSNNPNEQPGQPSVPRGIAPPVALPSASGSPGSNFSLAIAARESRLTNEFNNFLGRSPSGVNLSVNPAQREMSPLQIQEILQTNQAQTSVKSGVVYLTFNSSTAGTESPDDSLEVVLLTPEGTALRQTIPGATRSKVLNTALNFRGKITGRATRRFLPEAQQLYQWFIAPLESQLKTSGVNNLILITDGGLRSLPVAALHDGQGFLIERYSVTLVPTLTLTDLNYRDIRRSQILAMGSSQFSDKDPLPAVPLELQEVIGQLQGQSFLNESFTLDNFRRQRQQQPFQIIHLATHAVFAPGDQSNSYRTYAEIDSALTPSPSPAGEGRKN